MQNSCWIAPTLSLIHYYSIICTDRCSIQNPAPARSSTRGLMEEFSINARVNNDRVGEVWSLTAGGRTSNQPLIVTKYFIGWRTRETMG